MKKSLLILFLALLSVHASFSQSPDKFSYQALVRNSSGSILANTSVGMQISILEGSATGTVVYAETQTPTTNANGLISIEIGSGTVVSGSISAIDWSSDLFFVKTEIDLNGGTSYSITGTSQLLSVPYALHAKTAENFSGTITESDPTFTSSQASNITASDITNLGNLSGTNTGDQDISGIATNASAISNLQTEQTTQNSAIALNTAKNSYPATDASKLANIESNATADQTDAEIKTAYENNADTNAFTDAEKTKLASISGTNTGDQDISGIATNASAISNLQTEQTTQNSAIALNTAKVTNATHTGDVTGSTELTIGDGKVTDAKIASVAASKLTGAVSVSNGGTGTTTAPTQYGIIYANSTTQYASTGAGINGQILVSNGGSGTPIWATTTATRAPIMANLSTTPKILTNTGGEYTGSFITLPPGRWAVQITMLLPATSGEFWIRTSLSDTNTSSGGSSDIEGAGIVGGYQPEGKLNVLNGTLIINNTSGADKTYYYWTQGVDTYNSTTYQASNFGTGLPGENQMIAYPLN